MLKFAEIKNYSRDVLNKKVDELKKDLFMLKISKSTAGLDKPHLKREYKRTIARCLTAKKMADRK